MRIALSLFVAGIVGATAAFRGATPLTPATSHGAIPDAATPLTVTRVADLPPGVVAALGLRIADPGMPYQASDVVGPGEPLPSARLIWAQRDGRTWRVAYEHGGRGHYYALATLRPVATGWAVTTERGFKPQPPPNTP